MAKAEAGGSCRAAVFGSGIHRLQLQRQEGLTLQGFGDEPAPYNRAHTHRVYIHSSLQAPLGLIPQHLQPELHGWQKRSVDASQG